MLHIIVILFFLIVFSLPLAAANGKCEQNMFEPLWTLEDKGFVEPESIAFAPHGNSLFVTNVNGYAKNGLGFISRMDVNGNNLKLKWLDGLNGPTGIVYHQNKLYFADIDVLKVADATTGDIINQYPAPDPMPSLNDVAIDENGSVYVSASHLQTIYTLKDGKLISLIHDKNALKFANGLWVRHGQLISGGEALHLWDSVSGHYLKPLAPDNNQLTNIDGIGVDDKGNTLVSLLDDPRLWLITPEGKTAPVNNAQIHGIDFYLGRDRLFVPRIDVEKKEYKVSAYCYPES